MAILKISFQRGKFYAEVRQLLAGRIGVGDTMAEAIRDYMRQAGNLKLTNHTLQIDDSAAGLDMAYLPCGLDHMGVHLNSPLDYIPMTKDEAESFLKTHYMAAWVNLSAIPQPLTSLMRVYKK